MYTSGRGETIKKSSPLKKLKPTAQPIEFLPVHPHLKFTEINFYEEGLPYFCFGFTED